MTNERTADLRRWTPFLLVGVVATCESTSSPPTAAVPTDAVVVTIRTEGASLDADGYVVRLDGTAEHAVGIVENTTLTTRNVALEHEVELIGIAPNCVVQGANPRRVTVEGNVTSVDFTVACSHVPRDIVFTSDRNDRDQIYAVGVSGGGHASYTVRLGVLRGRASGPSWAPDGRRIAFLHYSGATRGHIAVMAAEGSRPVFLAEGDGDVSWSPDGRRLAFTWADWDGWFEPSVWTVNADGSNPDPFLAEAANPAWSPDGLRLAFDREGENVDIHLIDLDRSSPLALTDHPATDSDAAWSPEGTRIAFTSHRDGQADIYVVDTDGSNLVRLTYHPADDRGATWSPDGTRIAFTTDRDGNDEIYVMEVNDSGLVTELVNVTRHPARDRQPTWSPVAPRRPPAVIRH